MSYMRALCPYEYVDGESDGDYIFESVSGDGKGKGYIEDYGKIKNETIIDILLRKADNDKDILLKHLMLRLAENLKVKLRDKKLTYRQWDKLHSEIHKRECGDLKEWKKKGKGK